MFCLLPRKIHNPCFFIVCDIDVIGSSLITFDTNGRWEVDYRRCENCKVTGVSIWNTKDAKETIGFWVDVSVSMQSYLEMMNEDNKFVRNFTSTDSLLITNVSCIRFQVICTD